MPFVLPTFNLSCNIYTRPWNGTDPPRLVVDCQLRGQGNNFKAWAYSVTGFVGASWALFPPGTDLRDGFTTSGSNSDLVELPAGSGRFYGVGYVDDLGRGFPNEHRFAILTKSIAYPWPVPIP